MASNMPEVDHAVADMIAARGAPSVLKLKLIDVRSQYPNGPIFAVEGDIDRVVYSHWIYRLNSDLAYEFFVCNGKRAAKQLNNILAEDLSGLEKDIIFFVDRDFDDLSGFRDISSVFMLDRYSIENYLVDASVLDRILQLAFPLNGYPEVRSTVCGIFDTDYQRFLELSSEVNLLIYICRQLKIPIDDTIPKSIARITNVALGNVSSANVPAAEVIQVPVEISSGVVDALTRAFATLEPALRYRGKFAMKFFKIWIERLISELKNPSLGLFAPIGLGEHKVLSEELSFGAMASRSEIPDNLSGFLSRKGLL